MANRILVVDDNSDIRENICEYLNLRGIKRSVLRMLHRPLN